MDYSKIPFHDLNDQKIFPGKMNYLLYPASDDEESVFIHPRSFSIMNQDAEGTFLHDFREHHLLLYCLQGEGVLIYRGTSLIFDKGMGFFLDGNSLSEINAGSAGVQYTLFAMTGSLCGKLQEIAEERNAFIFDSEQFHDFEQRQFLLVNSFPRKVNGKEYDFSCHMNHLLVRILQLKPDNNMIKKDDHRQMIQQVLSYIHVHFREDINIKELAGQFHYSVSQFQKCFQEQTHCSVKQYLIRIRMQEAEKLLINTNFSVEEICTRCGFNNANHFICAFRQHYKTTPLQYRKTNQTLE